MSPYRFRLAFPAPRQTSKRRARRSAWAPALASIVLLVCVAAPSIAGEGALLGTSSTSPVSAAAPSARLHITVDLQGRPPAPHPAWSTPLDVTLTAGESIAWKDMVICDEQGAIEIDGLALTPYLVSVVGINTLTAQEMSPVLIEGANAMHMGPLLAGDLNGDDRIDIVDFSLFRGRFGSEDELGDLNNNGFVDILDFSLLRTNFGRWGPTSAD